MLQKIITFIRRNHKRKYISLSNKDILIEVLKHINSNTFDIIEKKEKIKAVVAYNITNEGTVANIIDLIIAKDENGFTAMKYFIARGWMRFPSLRYIKFERHYKDNKGYRLYRINKFFNKEIK